MRSPDQGLNMSRHPRMPAHISSSSDVTVAGGTGAYAALGSLLKNAVYRQVTPEEEQLLALWEDARPESLRDFDQIPMRGSDLLCQVKLIAPHLAGKRVVFVGDHDGTSLLLGLLSSHGLLRGPAQMALLDFDDCLLEVARTFAEGHHFSEWFAGRLYNVFDPPPKELIGTFDAFYTNPSYGASNSGASARLFITRGCELTNSVRSAGYILLPTDHERLWTRASMLATQTFLINHGLGVTTQLPQLHRYHLDDDATLMSSLLCVEREAAIMYAPPLPWQGRTVNPSEIPHFYGRDVLPPYPRYIAVDGRELTSLDALPEENQA